MNLEAKIASKKVDGGAWTQPNRFKLTGDGALEFESRLDSGEITTVIDPIEEIKDELFELQHPGVSRDSELGERFDSEMTKRGIGYGEWVHFPWSRSVVRYPERDDHRRLRTYRNQHLVTKEEQDVLNTATVAVFGLSVGSNITDQLVQSGIGDTYILGDFDRLSPTNLNRIRANLGQVGLRKIDVTAKKISETDPYIDQIHLHNGYTEQADYAMDMMRPSVIIEEVDDLTAKAHIRQYAAARRIPLVMVTDMGEKSIVDVERHDYEAVKPFNGKITSATYEDLIAGELTDKQKQQVLMKITGVRHLTPRLIESAMDIDRRLSGLPQLGATAVAGAALANTAVREILLNRKMESGTYVHSPARTLSMQRPTTRRQDVDTYRRFAKFLRK